MPDPKGPADGRVVSWPVEFVEGAILWPGGHHPHCIGGGKCDCRGLAGEPVNADGLLLADDPNHPVWAMTHGKNVLEENAQLRRDRDEMVEALEGVAELRCSHYDGDGNPIAAPDPGCIVCKVKALLARVKGR